MNVKDELITSIGDRKVICASISHETSFPVSLSGPPRFFKLKVGYTDEEFAVFLNNLDFEYYSGFGGQELYGTVWLDNEAWLTRGEYDGSEWWDFNEYPQPTEDLM